MIKFFAHGIIMGTSGNGLELKLRLKDSTEHWFEGEEIVFLKGKKFIEHLLKAFNVTQPLILAADNIKIEIILHK